MTTTTAWEHSFQWRDIDPLWGCENDNDDVLSQCHGLQRILNDLPDTDGFFGILSIDN